MNHNKFLFLSIIDLLSVCLILVSCNFGDLSGQNPPIEAYQTALALTPDSPAKQTVYALTQTVQAPIDATLTALAEYKQTETAQEEILLTQTGEAKVGLTRTARAFEKLTETAQAQAQETQEAADQTKEAADQTKQAKKLTATVIAATDQAIADELENNLPETPLLELSQLPPGYSRTQGIKYSQGYGQTNLSSVFNHPYAQISAEINFLEFAYTQLPHMWPDTMTLLEQPKIGLDSQFYQGDWGGQPITGCVVWAQKNIVFSLKFAQTGQEALPNAVQTVVNLCQAQLGFLPASISIPAPFPFPETVAAGRFTNYFKEIQFGLSTNSMDITPTTSLKSSEIVWAKLSGASQVYSYGIFYLEKTTYVEQMVGVPPMITQILGRIFEAGRYELRIAVGELIVMVIPFIVN